MNTRALRTAPILLLVLMVACEHSTGADAPVAGTYTLEEVNGAALPASIPDGEATILVKSGSIVLTDQKSWSERIQIEYGDPGAPPEPLEVQDGGSYTVRSGALRLMSDDGSVYTGQVSGGTLTYTVHASAPTVVLTYRR